jgi:hypothetical protein
MKVMTKKIGLGIIILLMSVSVYAQRVGIRGGLQFNDMRNEPDNSQGLSQTKSLLFGYNVGIVFDNRINDIFFFQPGILLTSKGSKTEESITGGGITSTSTYKFNPLYIEVPFMLGIRIGTERFKVFGMAGPYLAYGIAGKSSFKNVVNNTPIIESNEAIKWGNKSSLTDAKELRRFDMGLSFSAGVEIKNLQLGAFYSPGLFNISPDGNGRKLYNTSVGINATLLLGRKQ